MSTVVVAIDGPSGSGKSSVSKGVAQQFDLAYLDTGAMYRAMTWFMLNQGIDLADSAAIARVVGAAKIVNGTDPAAPTISVNGADVAEAIRSAEVTATVSAVSAVPAVRARLVESQRGAVLSCANPAGIVVEGRDIGSVVLPDADPKIYLTADPQVRAQRRSAENQELNRGTQDLTATAQALQNRDAVDRARKASPLQLSADATVVDATDMTLLETIAAVAQLVTVARETDGSAT
jgi:cytidylate kinase